MYKKRYFKYVLGLLLGMVMTATLASCSDDPDESNYYTYTNEMVSDYLKAHDEFSSFVKVVERAGMMDFLATHGAYTCFPPTNEAFDKYLKKLGLTSVDQLSDLDCDTLARTHIVQNMYATSDMEDGALTTANMNRRYLEVTHGLDADSNAVVILNRSANIIFAMQDDSVENGIMQPVDAVLESTNRMLPDVIGQNPRISLFYQALVATGLSSQMYKYKDENYDASLYPRYKYTSHVNKETATAPDEKRYGFTAFVPTDSILELKYGITTLEQLYQKACEIYDVTYPDDANQPYHAFDQLTDERNPLHRFIAYHILTRDVTGYNYLTPLNDICIATTKMHPVDWYETMLPHTMVKIEKLTMLKYADADQMRVCYINRRRDDEYKIRGAMISQTVENGTENDALNGRYFYVDDIVAFDEQTQNIVQNVRIRMDVSTIFPELMTNGIRQNGNPRKQDPSGDETDKYGRNYYFPEGYLDNVKCSGYFIYRRPHDNFDCYEGDEFNLFGNYDFTFKLPPVPYEGDWQIRLGYAAEGTRGIAQIYFDGQPQGIPLDMTKLLNNSTIIGSSTWTADWTKFSTTELASDQKMFKNKGYYRGADGGYRYDSEGGSTYRYFSTLETTLRRVLCTVHIDPSTDHYLRIRSVSTKQGNNNEFMLDYIELVPKSIYGVTDEGEIEDML